MLKKWQWISMALTLSVCMLTILSFTQAAAAKSVVSHQPAARRLFCEASAQKPVAWPNKIVAKGSITCEKSTQLRVEIILYKVLIDDQIRIGQASEEQRDRALRVSIDRYCQPGFYRSEVIGYTWDVYRQDWSRVASVSSNITRARCLFRSH